MPFTAPGKIKDSRRGEEDEYHKKHQKEVVVFGIYGGVRGKKNWRTMKVRSLGMRMGRLQTTCSQGKECRV